LTEGAERSSRLRHETNVEWWKDQPKGCSENLGFWIENGLSVRSRMWRVNIKTSLDAVAINVMLKKTNKVQKDNVETPTQAQTGDEEADV
jgi:hypothetical protein